MEDQHSDTNFIDEMTSYSFEYYDQATLSHTACSNSEFGKIFISELNHMLNQKPIREELVDIMVENKIPSDKRRLREIIEANYQ